MSLQEVLAILAASPLVQQLAPILVVILIPLLVLSTHAHVASLFDPLRMVFEFWWRRSSTSSRDAGSERKKIKKKPRTRAEQAALIQNGASTWFTMLRITLDLT